MNLNKLVANILEEFAEKLNCGNSNLTEKEALELISQIAHISMSKQDVADRYGVSTKTIERKEKLGEIPEGHNTTSSKRNWYLDELLIFEHNNNI